jgi:hypothetical protein
VDSVEGKVFSHSLRVRILGSLGYRPASVRQLSHKLDQPIGKVAYHIIVLCDTGYVALVEGQDPAEPNPLYEPTRRR